MRLFKRSQDRKSTRTQYRPRLEALETRLCLACDLQLLVDGTLQITGGDRDEIVVIEDGGNGDVSVLCQERGDEREAPRIFSGVTAIEVDLKGGDDEFDYRSFPDVNPLSDLEVRLGDGNDRAHVGIMECWPKKWKGFTLDGGAGNDSLLTNITTSTSSNDPTQRGIRVEIDGVEDTRLSFEAGDFMISLAAVNIGPVPLGSVTFVVDGTHGVPGTSCSTTGVRAEGYPVFDFVLASQEPMKVELDYNPFVTIDYRERNLGAFLALDASNFTGGIAMHASQREGTSLILEDVELSGDMAVDFEGDGDFTREINGMRINDGGSYQETIRTANDGQGSRGFGFVTMDTDDLHIAEGGSFGSQIMGGRAADHVVNLLKNVVNHGELMVIVHGWDRHNKKEIVGKDADSVAFWLNGFENYGTATFDTRLGAGADSFNFEARGIYVAPDASFAVQVDGGAGRDEILANVRATVDGNYRFEARGGLGADEIRVVQEIDTHWRNDRPRESDRRPAIHLLFEGNDGNDLLELLLLAPDVDDELLKALVDGGNGQDTACVSGPVRVVNVERRCR